MLCETPITMLCFHHQRDEVALQRINSKKSSLIHNFGALYSFVTQKCFFYVLSLSENLAGDGHWQRDTALL